MDVSRRREPGVQVDSLHVGKDGARVSNGVTASRYFTILIYLHIKHE